MSSNEKSQLFPKELSGNHGTVCRNIHREPVYQTHILCRRSFCRDFGLQTEDAGVFCRTQWKLPWLVWFTYRLVLALYYVSFLGYTFSTFESPSEAGSWLTALSDWTFLVVMTYLLVALINLLLDRKHGMHFHEGKDSDDIKIESKFRHKLHWLLLNVTTNVSMMVMITYWSFLEGDGLTVYMDITLHVFPTIIGLVDVIITPIPIRLQHAVYPAAYAILYVIFTAILFAAGGTSAVYPGFLDWKNLGTTFLTIGGCTVAVCILQLFMWGIYKIKMIIIQRFTPYSSSPATAGVDERTLEV